MGLIFNGSEERDFLDLVRLVLKVRSVVRCVIVVFGVIIFIWVVRWLLLFWVEIVRIEWVVVRGYFKI